jgi:hypothetical protein
MKTDLDKKSIFRGSGICLVLVGLLFFSGCAETKPIPEPYPRQGILDLANWEFEQFGTLDLTGEWAFYWEKLLSFDDLPSNSPDAYVKVPEVWNNYWLEDHYLPGEGYATYRLQVINAEPDRRLALKLQTMSTAYKLMINQQTIAVNGSVGTNPEQHQPEYSQMM